MPGVFFVKYLHHDPVSPAATTVTVNGHPPTQRSSALWYYEQSVLNPDGPVRRVVDIAASSSTGGRSNGPVTTHQKGALFIPPPIETPNYDVDGNQTSDARWNYTWDGENRLIAQEEKFGIPVVQEETPGNLVQLPTATVTRKRLAFTYDSRGRRITKSVSIATGTGSFVLQQSLVYLYDGWNMIAEIDTTTSSAQLLRSYEWGTDISGTMTGAGGVGGLLLVRFYAATSTTASSSPPPPAGGYAPLYDGNGNITELFNLAYSTVSASYEYGAFGETISIDGGPVAAANPFRFSTKYVDVETGLYNYGYRYYDAVNGRWLSRDPIGERGGINLYGMLSNDPVNRWDYLGMFPDLPGHGDSTSPENIINEIWSVQNFTDIKYKSSSGIDLNMVRLKAFVEHFNPDSGNSFVFTCKYGWIDLYHFWNTARVSYYIGDVATVLGGIGVEVLQTLGEPTTNAGASASGGDKVEPSYFSPEDLQSNSLGADFGQTAGEHDVLVIRRYLQSRGKIGMFGGRMNLPLSADALYNLAGGWQRLLREGGAVSWKSFALQDAIAKDLEEYKAQRPKVFNLSQAQAFKLKSNIYKCACQGNQPFPRYRMSGFFLPR